MKYSSVPFSVPLCDASEPENKQFHLAIFDMINYTWALDCDYVNMSCSLSRAFCVTFCILACNLF